MESSVVLLNHAVSGAIALAAAAVGLFFHRYWRASRERLFIILAMGFWLLAIERLALISLPLQFVPLHEESRHWVHILRLLAFLSIAAAVIDKNRTRRG